MVLPNLMLLLPFHRLVLGGSSRSQSLESLLVTGCCLKMHFSVVRESQLLVINQEGQQKGKVGLLDGLKEIFLEVVRRSLTWG